MKTVALLTSLLGLPCIAADSPHITVAGRDVAVWKPARAAPPQGYPLVLFSHGFSGCNTQSTFLMEALAEAGYFVLAPNHEDAHCGSARNSGAGWNPEEPFQKAGDWTDATYRSRATGLRTVLDTVLREKTFQGVPVDSSRVGLAGHSLGGYTVLGLAGAWPSWKDTRIKAVLALSPYCSPYLKRGDLGHMNVPVMYQGGALDLGISPFVRGPNGAYDLSSAPKYYMELQGAGHLAWTNLNRKFQELIDTYSVAFFDRYLKSNTNPSPLQPLMRKPPPKGVSDLRAAER